MKMAIKEAKWFFNQLFSASPQTDVPSGTKFLSWMSKGLLMVGAITSISSTAPNMYNIWQGVFPVYLAQIATIICVILLLFLVELSFGVLAPFCLSFTVSNKILHSRSYTLAGILIWLIVIFLGTMSIRFTWQGGAILIQRSIKNVEMLNIAELEGKKQNALRIEASRFDSLYTIQSRKDSATLAQIKNQQHKNIVAVHRYADKRYGSHSGYYEQAMKRVRKDSINRVDEFEPKAPFILRDRQLAIDDSRNTHNSIIKDAKKENNRREKDHKKKVSAALLIIQGFGSGATVISFILIFIVTLLKKKGSSMKKGRGEPKAQPETIEFQSSIFSNNYETTETSETNNGSFEVLGFSSPMPLRDVRKKVQIYANRYATNYGNPDTAVTHARNAYKIYAQNAPKQDVDSLDTYLISQHPEFYRLIV